MSSSRSSAQLRQFLLQSRNWRRGYMPWALLASLLIHAALLSLHFGAPAQAPNPVRSTLDIVLVNTHTDTAPLKAQAQAQYDLNAGGDQAQGMATSPLPHSPELAAQDMILRALRKRQAALEQEQQRLLTQLQAGLVVAPEQLVPDPLRQSEAPGEDDIAQENQILQARIAALEARIAHYNARPRQHFTGPATTAAEHAAYVESWRKRIEALGTRYYPDEARGQLYGSLQLTAYIQRNGELAGIEIDRPSEHVVLNQAAQRIVRLAAPFPPFPPELAEHTDVLAISRTWHFTRDQLQTFAP
ncbi:TonB family protein [Pusillimonas sp. CC-YST705]|uniref:TonB family protein n=1 Tax=Mesopusillimonas faecipullorum TaxID=2755040 RepID=A0ABS8C9D8_9BURK|nr:TonB family protein [Mesopusillimonas faecipullorum]MCB5362640.1 TonB family protein [Mesopusillimonas faecipullorum]